MDLTILEKNILNYVLSNLTEDESLILKAQISYLVNLKRIKYKYDVITEMYPESFGIIPAEKLFKRTEEFSLAKIKFRIQNVIYKSEIGMVLGQLFDLKIKPIPHENVNIDLIEYIEISINEELEKNTR